MRIDRKEQHELEQTLAKIKAMENMVNEPYYDLSQQQKIQINIRIQNDVPPAMFKPDPKLDGGWIANELTYRAMKKDIFAQGEDLEDLQEIYLCNCNNKIDKQFWHFCPHCGSKF